MEIEIWVFTSFPGHASPHIAPLNSLMHGEWKWHDCHGNKFMITDLQILAGDRRIPCLQRKMTPIPWALAGWAWRQTLQHSPQGTSPAWCREWGTHPCLGHGPRPTPTGPLCSPASLPEWWQPPPMLCSAEPSLPSLVLMIIMCGKGVHKIT